MYNRLCSQTEYRGCVALHKKGWVWTAVVSGGHFWVDFYTNMLIPLLPMLALTWGLNNSQLALLVSVQSMTTNFMQPVFGYYVDKYPKKWSLGIAVLAIGLPMCFLYLMESYLSFMVLITLAGIGSALYHPLGAARVIAGENGEKAVKMSLYSGLGSLGYAISPAVTAFMVALWGLKGLSLMIIPGILWVVLLKWSEPRERTGKEEPEPQAGKEKKPSTIKFAEYRSLFLLSCIVGCRSWLVTATIVLIPLWLVAQGTSEQAAGFQLTLYLLAGTVGGIFYGMAYKKIRPDVLLLASFLISLLLVPVYFYSPPALRLLVLIILGLVLRGTSPITVVIGQEILPRHAAFASGVTMGLAYGLGALGVSLTGLLADLWGEAPAVLVNSLVLLPAGLLTLYLRSRWPKKKSITNSPGM